MAAVSTLSMEFATATGETTTLSYKYAKPTITAQNVSDLMDTIISEGSIFEKVPVVKKSAKLVTTTESEYELSA